MTRPLPPESSSARLSRSSWRPKALCVALALVALLFGSHARAAQNASGFPLKLPALISSPIALGNLGGMPRLYFTVATPGGGSLFCVTAAGADCAGFPLSLGKDAAIIGAPAVADLDADGGEEIAVLLTDGSLRAFRDDGSEFLSLPRTGEASASTPLTLADLDSDGRPDLVFADAARQLHALNARGRSLPGFPRRLRAPVTSPISWGFGGEGDRRVLLWGGEDGRLNAIFADGAVVPGFPKATGYLISAQPALADVEGEGRLSVAFASQDFKIHAADLDGKQRPGFPVDTGARLKDGPALARLTDGVGRSVVVAATDGRLHVLDAKGKARKGFPVTLAERLVGAPLAVDLDGDGIDELLTASADGRLHALRPNARPFSGFPVQLKGLPDSGPVAFAWEDAILVAQGAGETLHAFRVRPKTASRLPLTWPEPGHDSTRSGRLTPNAPLYRDLVLSPERPTVGDAIELGYRFIDLDGRPEPKLGVRWLRDGKVFPEADGLRVLPAGMARKGERWTPKIESEGARVLGQPSVVVRNTPPPAPSVVIEPSIPTREGGARAVIVSQARDADGDAVSYRYRWFVDGKVLPKAQGDSVGAGVLRRGSQVVVEVVASDGQEKSEAVRAEAMVGNSRPGKPEARLSQKAPKCGEEIEVLIERPAADADGDKVGYRTRLFIDGKRAPLTRERLSVPTRLAGKTSELMVEVVAFDGHEEGEAVRLKARVANCPPSAPTAAIWPLKPVSGDALEGRLEVPASDFDGDAVSYRFSFIKNGKEVGERVSGVKKGERYELAVVATDGSAETRGKRASVVVGNTPPEAPVLGWQKATARGGDALEVRVVRPSTDRDGDAVSYRYGWKRDGMPVKGATGPRIEGRVEGPQKGERWQVTVTPHDGVEAGRASRLAITIGNTAPEAPEVSIEPSRPVAGEAVRAVITRRARDADGDEVSYRYRWFVDGLELELSPETSSLTAERLNGARRVSVIATPFDGEEVGPEARAEAVVSPRAPEAPRVSLSPQNPRLGEIVECRVSSGKGSKSATDAFEWFIDGKPLRLGPASSRLEVSRARAGQSISCAVTRTEGELSARAESQRVVVRNTPPAAPSVVIEPSIPTREGGARAVIVSQARDADGDAVSYRYRWFVDGKVLPKAQGDSVGAGVLRRGSQVVVEVVASDGQEKSEAVRAEAMVGNSRPGKPEARLSQKAPKCGEEIEVLIERPAADADGDKVGYRTRLFIDGKRAPLTRERLSVPTRLAGKTSELMVEVVAFDGHEEGEAVRLKARVANCPPSAPTAAIWPLKPVSGDALEGRLEVPASDFDGDAVSYRFSFIKNGKEVGERVSGVKKGERYELAVVATDGSAETRGKRASVVVGNTPPEAPVLGWQKATARGGDALEVRVVRPSTDRDGDAVSYRYGWKRDGMPVKGATGPRIEGRVEGPQKGERWQVTVTPHDGVEAGRASRLAITIGNTAPEAPEVSIEPSRPVAGEAVRAVITRRARDADGDEVSYRYRWFVDGLELELSPETSSLTAERLNGARRVSVIATPFDGEEVGPEARAEAVVSPRAPEAPRVSLSPQNPRLGEIVECRVSSGKGSKSATDAFEWFIDGKPLRLGPASSRLEVSRARAGQSISCAVTRTEGELSARAESQRVVVQNIAPSAPEIAVEPREPRSGDDLFCRIVKPARDANGGVLRYDYRWTQDGAPIQASADEPWRLKAEQLRRGPLYRCEVTAHNEIGASPKVRAERRYANSLPGAPRVRLSPSAPKSRDSLTCELVAEARDADGDRLSYRFIWWKNDQEQSLAATTQRIPARMTRPGERWRCGAEASDSEGRGPRHRSAEVRVE